MSDLRETGKRKPAGQAAKKGSQRSERKPTSLAAVEKMIEKFQEKLDQADFKVTVGDYIRLVQLREELGDEEPKEIRVTWVEAAEQELCDEK